MYQHPYYGNAPPQPRRRTSSKPRKERPDVDKIVDGVISQLKIKGLFDQFRRDCLSDVDTKPSYINLQSKINGTIDNFLKGQMWTSNFPKLKVRDAMKQKIEQAPYFGKGIDSIVDQVLSTKVESIFKSTIEEEVFSFMGFEKNEYDEKQRLKQQEEEEQSQRPPSPPEDNGRGEEEHRPFRMLGSDFYQMPIYANTNNEQSASNVSPPPLPPTEPPPPPPEEEDEFEDQQMDYTPVTPPYPPPPDCQDPFDEPLPPGEEADSNSNMHQFLEPGVKLHVTNGSFTVANGPPELEKSQTVPPSIHLHMNGWAHDHEDEDNMDLAISPKSECVEEEDSEEESPMFEKIGEVSPPRPVVLENSDDILKELQEQARLNSSNAKREIFKEVIEGRNGGIAMKTSSDVFENNSEDSGSSNLVICEDYSTPPQEPAFKSEDNSNRRNRSRTQYSENSNSSSTSTPHKHSYSSSKDKKDSPWKESSSKESQPLSHSSNSSRHRSRSSRSSSGHRSRDRDRDRDSSSSKDRNQDKEKHREKMESSSKSSQGSRSQNKHHHSPSSSSLNRSSSSHSSHKHSNSSSTSHRHSSSSHKHSSRRSSSSAKSERHSTSHTSEKDAQSKSTALKCGENPPDGNHRKEIEVSNSIEQIMSSKLSDTPESPFKLPEQLKPFASIDMSKSNERDHTIVVQPTTTFSITMDDSSKPELEEDTSTKSMDIVESAENYIKFDPMDVSEDKVPSECDNEDKEPSPSKELGCPEEIDENCRYLEPIPVFEEKLSYYRKLPEYQIH